MSTVTLRKFAGDPSDSCLLVAWRNDPANARWFPRQDPWTVEGQQSWYQESYQRDPRQHLYVVELDGAPIGAIGVTQRKYAEGEIGRMVLGAKSVARGGYMREAAKQMLRAHGFTWYFLEVLPDNVACIRFWEKLDFTVIRRQGTLYEDVNGQKGRYLVMERRFNGVFQEDAA